MNITTFLRNCVRFPEPQRFAPENLAQGVAPTLNSVVETLHWPLAIKIGGPVLALALFFGGASIQAQSVAPHASLAAGEGHTLLLKSDGTVWSIGSNPPGTAGEVEVGAMPVVGASGITAVASGLYHGLALKSDGTVLSWGTNEHGQLGDGTNDSSGELVTVTGLAGVVAVAAGDWHSVAVTSDGSVWTWGKNDVGQLGDGTNVDSNVPHKVAGITHAVNAAAGTGHSVVLNNDGRVITWGVNSNGEMGVGNNSIWTTKEVVAGLDHVVAVRAAGHQTFAVKDNGGVWAWGKNDHGQLGDGTKTASLSPKRITALVDVAAVVPGPNHTVVVKSNGATLVFGDNSEGQLGNGTTTERLTPLSLDVPPLNRRVVAAGVGTRHTVIVRDDGSVWACGSNAAGQLGVGAVALRTTPVEVSGVGDVKSLALGLFHGLALKTDGSVKGWGTNGYGQIGDGTQADREKPVALPALSGVVGVAAGDYNSAAVTTAGQVWTWGDNTYGQLADASVTERTTPLAVSGLTGMTTVDSEGNHVLALKSNGTVWAWGDNSHGQLGNGASTLSPVNTPVQVSTSTGMGTVSAVAAGRTHSLALTATGEVWSWGSNDEGQLGDGGTASHTSPVHVTGLGGLSPVVAVAAGDGHSVALKADGTLWAWGDNAHGQLGDGTDDDQLSPIQITGISGVVSVTASEHHTAVVLSDGAVWSWGYNHSGQLGDGSTDDQINPAEVLQVTGAVMVAAGNIGTAAVKEDGSVVVWGTYSPTQLGEGIIAMSTSPVRVTGINTILDPPTVAITAPADDTMVPLGNAQPLDVTFTAAMGAGLPASVSFFHHGTLLGTDSTPPFTFSFSPSTWGHFPITAIGVDSLGYYSSRSVPLSLVVPYDSDANAVPDWWELRYFGGLGGDFYGDPDHDHYTNAEEFTNGTDPLVADPLPPSPNTPVYINLSGWQSQPGQDAPSAGTVTVTDSGFGLSLAGNRWVQVPFNYTVTADTVLEFEYKGTIEGEIHAVGLDENTNEADTKRIFQIWGKDVWSNGHQPGDYDAYKFHATDWKTYRIRVGKFQTGAMHYLMVTNDHDAAPKNAASQIRNVRAYESPVYDSLGRVNLGVWGGFAMAGSGDRPKEGTVSATWDGREIEMIGNRWVQVRVDYTMTPNTVVEFAYRGDIQGDLHAIGLDENSLLEDSLRVVRLHGSQTWPSLGVPASDQYGTLGVWKKYRLKIGQNYTGLKRFLVLANDHDVTTPNAQARFKDVRLFERDETDLTDTDGDGMPDWWEEDYGLNPRFDDANGNKDGDSRTNLQEYLDETNPIDPEGPLLPNGYLDLRPFQSHTAQDVPESGTVTVQNEGEGLTLTGNRWVQVPVDYDVTADTVLEFEFKGTTQGSVHAVGLDENTNEYDTKRLFQVWGSGTWSNGHQPGDYDRYSYHAPDWKTYRIRVGQYQTGMMHYFVIANDHSVIPATGSSQVRRVRVYDAPVTDSAGRIDLRFWNGYSLAASGDQPQQGTVTPSADGKEIRLVGNRWVQVRVDYTVTANTLIEFDYQGELEGEMHAVGLDENTVLTDTPRLFQFQGTEWWTGLRRVTAAERYRKPAVATSPPTAAPWKHYALRPGQGTGAALGLMKYLVLGNDHDVEPRNASSRIKNVRITEQTYDLDNDGLPDFWEQQYFLTDPGADPDHDRLTNLEEYRAGTNPHDPDTDHDGLTDWLSGPTLLGAWRFDAMDGGNVDGKVVKDSSNSGADGVSLEGVEYEAVAGVQGKGGKFGLEDYSRVQVPPDLLEGHKDISVSFWMRSPDAGEGGVFSAASVANHNAFLALIREGKFRIFTNTATTHLEWDVNLNDDAWHHVVLSRDGTAGKATLYVDGVSQGEQTGTFVAADIDYMVIGHDADSVTGGLEPYQRYKGYLDEVRLYSEAISAEKAQRLAFWPGRLNDRDHDDMLDSWEQLYGAYDPVSDPDEDRYTNLEEFQRGTNPLEATNFDYGELPGTPAPESVFLWYRLGIKTAGSEIFNYPPLWSYLSPGQTANLGAVAYTPPDEEDFISYELSIQTMGGLGYVLSADISGSHLGWFYFNITAVDDDNDRDGLGNSLEAALGSNPDLADTDGDLMPDRWEYLRGLNLVVAALEDEDTDGDGLSDLDEYYAGSDPQTGDTDGDFLGDKWELESGFPFNPSFVNDAYADTDGDGLDDIFEYIFSTNPHIPDTDFDGMPDFWEVAFGLDPLDDADATLDPDADGLTNLVEFHFEGSPIALDYDNDELSDVWEIMQGNFPSDPDDADLASNYRDGLTNLFHHNDPGTDTDGDGLSDLAEGLWTTMLNLVDTDGDGLSDGFEVANALDPKNDDDAAGDPDQDGVSNLEEFGQQLLVWDFDTDDDGLGDGFEIQHNGTPRSLLEGLQAWWRFDDHTFPMLDYSGNRNDGHLHDKAAAGTRAKPWADVGHYPLDEIATSSPTLSLHGNGAFGAVKHDDSLVPASALTWMFWVMPDAGDRTLTMPLLEKKGSYAVKLMADRKLEVTFIDDTSATLTVQSTGTIAAGAWMHVAVSFDQAAGEVKIYFNGVLDSTHASTLGSLGATEWPLIFGHPRSYPALAPEAQMDDARLYDRILTTTDIGTLASTDAQPDALEDWDDDGANNLQEFYNGTNPHQTDSDGDGISDGAEINGHLVGGITYYSNPRRTDTDNDGLADLHEMSVTLTNPGSPDTDGDGIWDGTEIRVHGTDPKDNDTDNDGMRDGWEVRYKLNPLVNDAAGNPDGDALTNLQEFVADTNPLVKNGIDFGLDTDGDTLTDYEEIYLLGTNPTTKNTYTGISDLDRHNSDTIPPSATPNPTGDPGQPPPPEGSDPGPGYDSDDDIDGDGISNGAEIANGTDPKDAANEVKQAFGPSSISEREKITVTEGDQYEPYFTYGSATVTLHAPEKTPVVLAQSPEQHNLFVSGRMILTGAGAAKTIVVAEGGSFTDPMKHLGSQADAAYTFVSSADITDFVNQLQRDEKDMVTFTIKREALKNVTKLPREGPPPPETDPDKPTNPGGGGGGGGGGDGGGWAGFVGAIRIGLGGWGDTLGSEGEEDDGEAFASSAVMVIANPAKCSACSETATICPDPRLGSVHYTLNLGKTSFGRQPLALSLDTGALHEGVLGPNFLRIRGGQYAEIIRDSGNVLRQMLSAELLADIKVVNTRKYQIHFYHASAKGTKDVNGFYQPVGDAIRIITVENPNAPSLPFDTLRFTDTDGLGAMPRVYEFTHDTVADEWGLVSGGGVRKEFLKTTWNAGKTQKTERRTIKNSDNVAVSMTDAIHTVFPWGTEITSEVNDPTGAALTTTYVYYTDILQDGPAYGRLKQKTEHSGHWEKYYYDATGQQNKVVTQYLDHASTTADNLNRVRTMTRAAVNPVYTEIETVLGVEVSRRFSAKFGNEEEWDIHCVRPNAAWNAADNLITRTFTHASGDFAGETYRVVHPDGTLTLTSSTIDVGVKTTVTRSGAPNANRTDVIDGTQTTTVVNGAGQWETEETLDIASGLVIAGREVTTREERGRPTLITYLDGTTEAFEFTCCGLVSETDRDGIESTHAYDDLKRRTHTTRLGITRRTYYDAEGRVLMVVRIGSDDSEIVQEENIYDLAGRQTSTRKALNHTTSTAETYAAGEVIQTTTLPDGVTTQISKAYPDGQAQSEGGTGSHPVKYAYGVENGQLYTQQIRVSTGGAETEWVKTFADLAGRPVRTVYPDGAMEQQGYNALGQLAFSRDADGITQLYAYNGKGEQTVTALDVNGNGVIDEAGQDRISHTSRSFITAHGKTVQKTETEVFTTNDDDATQSVSVSESSIDGLEVWQTQFGLTSHRAKVRTSAGAWTETVTSPDDSVTISVTTAGRLASITQKASLAGTQLGKVDYAYDPHGRLLTQTDARNGATTFGYDDLDRVLSTTQPRADGVSGVLTRQVTQARYNNLGQMVKSIHPDNSETEYEYHPTGELKKTFGAQTYPVEYTYDPQGRQKTITTQGQAGPAVTTWNYHSQRGWLMSKQDDAGKGTDYTYTPAGRLDTRAWDRGVITTYGYEGTDLVSVDYSDSTPDVTYTYDRQGRRKTVVDASGTRTLAYTSEGRLDKESYTAGLMDGLELDHGYDVLLRRDEVKLKDGATTLRTQGYTYGDASRLKSTFVGDDSVKYDYTTNSPLIETVAFKRDTTTVITTTKVHDFVNRLTFTSSVAGATTVSSHTYTHNVLNQRERAEEADGQYWTYDYNTKGEVGNGTKHDALDNALAGLNLGYTFDDIGNRLTTTVDAALDTTYTANKLNQYVAITATATAVPVHDTDGNLADDATKLFTYDGENRLSTVSRKSDNALIATYTYDDKSRRVRKLTTAIATQGATDLVFLWDGWIMVGELAHSSGTFSPTRYYAWGLDLSGSAQGAGGVGGLVMIEDAASDEVYMPSYDGNGNVVSLVKASDGGIAASYEYDPFGKLVSSGGAYSVSNPHRFSTKYQDAETGFSYYGFRYYEASAGRWLSRDPIEEEGGINLHGMCGNDLLNKVDLLGLEIEVDSKFVSRTEMDNELGKGYNGFTGSAKDTSAIALPEEEGEDTFEDVRPGCVRIKKAKTLKLRVRVRYLTRAEAKTKPFKLFRDWGDNWYTDSGYLALLGHEGRRQLVYEWGHKEYLENSEKTGTQVMKCDLFHASGGLSAREVAENYLKALRAKAIDDYTNYIRRENDLIGAESAERNWTKIRNARDQYINIHQPTPPKQWDGIKCPNSK